MALGFFSYPDLRAGYIVVVHRCVCKRVSYFRTKRKRFCACCRKCGTETEVVAPGPE